MKVFFCSFESIRIVSSKSYYIFHERSTGKICPARTSELGAETCSDPHRGSQKWDQFFDIYIQNLAHYAMVYIFPLLMDWGITWLKRRNYLNSGGATANHSNGIIFKIHSMFPICAMHEFSFESIQSLDVWVLPCTMGEVYCQS